LPCVVVPSHSRLMRRFDRGWESPRVAPGCWGWGGARGDTSHWTERAVFPWGWLAKDGSVNHDYKKIVRRDIVEVVTDWKNMLAIVSTIWLSSYPNKPVSLLHFTMTDCWNSLPLHSGHSSRSWSQIWATPCYGSIIGRKHHLEERELLCAGSEQLVQRRGCHCRSGLPYSLIRSRYNHSLV
jgi:hypothetical protein